MKRILIILAFLLASGGKEVFAQNLGLPEKCRTAALLPRKRWWSAKNLQTASTAAGIYDLRLQQIGRCGALALKALHAPDRCTGYRTFLLETAEFLDQV